MSEKKTSSTKSNSRQTLKSVSIGYESKLANALSAESYDPKTVDEWYRDQRKASMAYAKELVAG